MPDLNKLPDFISLQSKAQIEAAASDEKMPTFTMTAYNGGAMYVHGFDLPVVVDLEGMEIERQDIPVRMDHDAAKGVGHTLKIDKSETCLEAQGVISRDTSWARDVANSGKRGFPWQVSIGAPVYKYKYVAPNESVFVNGREISGECYIVLQSKLKEVSFVDSGADSSTEAEITAKNNSITKGKQMPEATKEVKADAKPEKKVEAKADETKKVEVKAAEPKKVEAKAVDPIANMNEEIAANTERISKIQTHCGTQHHDIMAQAIRENWSPEKAELAVLRAGRPSAPAGFVRGSQDNTPKVIEAAALMSTGRVDVSESFDEKTLEAADKLRGCGIQELIEIACGAPLPRYNSNPEEWLRAAFSNVSVPGILSNVANKTLLEGFNYTDQAWRKLFKTASVSDFKEHTRYRMTDDFKFKKVGPGGNLEHGKIGEESFSNKIDTSGIMFALTRQMIINDDLGAFVEIPWRIGYGAGEAINEEVWTLFLGLVAAGFFSSGNNNYLVGADTALSDDSLCVAENLFSTRLKPGKKKGNKQPLGILPKYLLAPTKLKHKARRLLESDELKDSDGNIVKNTHKGDFEIVATPRISAAFGGSDVAWHLLADPRVLAAIEIAFLHGKDTPTVESTNADFNTLGVNFRGYIDFGTKEQDHRAAVKMKGEV